MYFEYRYALQMFIQILENRHVLIHVFESICFDLPKMLVRTLVIDIIKLKLVACQ